MLVAPSLFLYEVLVIMIHFVHLLGMVLLSKSEEKTSEWEEGREGKKIRGGRSSGLLRTGKLQQQQKNRYGCLTNILG